MYCSASSSDIPRHSQNIHSAIHGLRKAAVDLVLVDASSETAPECVDVKLEFCDRWPVHKAGHHEQKVRDQ